MRYLDLTFATPQENLACDEALLDWCEHGDGCETLRFWESPIHFVVVGYSNRVRANVDIGACESNGIPVLRRCTGGGTVLQGPGCLNYTLILRIPETGPLTRLTSTNQFIMEQHHAALAKLTGDAVVVRGTTDLAVGDLKFSGNAQRRRQHCLLFHGTFLHNFKIALVEKYLLVPSRQPTYRRARPHAEFLTNIPLASHQIKNVLTRCWNADDALAGFPSEMVHNLAANRYSSREWTFKL
ncbi:MAG: lipoate--protein ligase family protein [Verrucomicrobiia bacterium]